MELIGQFEARQEWTKYVEGPTVTTMHYRQGHVLMYIYQEILLYFDSKSNSLEKPSQHLHYSVTTIYLPREAVLGST